jgi:hypothetical protein
VRAPPPPSTNPRRPSRDSACSPPSPLAIRAIDHRFVSAVALGGRRAVGVELLCLQRDANIST